MRLGDSVQVLPGVGPQRAAQLEKLGLTNLADLLMHFPRRYLDLRALTPIAELKGGVAVVKARLAGLPRVYRGRRAVTEATVTDGTGSLRLVWFDQPYAQGLMRLDTDYVIYGEISTQQDRLQMVHPQLQPFDPAQGAPGMLAVYALGAGIGQKMLRRFIGAALPVADQLPETLSAALRARLGLAGRAEAVRLLHAPSCPEDVQRGRERLEMEALLAHQGAVQLLRAQRRETQVPPLSWPQAPIDAILQALPYRMTGAQQRCYEQICQDLGSGSPMLRLIQGDVGSGKTLVAALALAAAALSGGQGALLAPTDLLARQHAESLQRLLAPAGIRVGLLTGQMSAKERRRALDYILVGSWQVVVGTHALMSKAVDYADLRLAVIDEQHRFGTLQREALVDKGAAVHTLALSATPIPRTLALALYGDMDVSVIDELPPGREPIKTHLVSPAKREGMYSFIRGLVERGRQAYVVCPRVEPGDEEPGELPRAASAQQVQKELLQGPLAGLRVGLVHGAMAAKRAQDTLLAFKAGELDVLVATTVIEVGVDVPNAVAMVVEDAGRFGLAQLHQLRGRVGRGGGESFCFLLPGSLPDSVERLRILKDSTDGFEIARTDLSLRGAGEILGTRQSGVDPLLPLSDSAARWEQAQRQAQAILQGEDETLRADLTALAQAQYGNWLRTRLA